MQHGTASDTELWTKMQHGDKAAFALLYQKHVPLLYRYSRQFRLDAEQAQDCIQELFVEIWKRRSHLATVQVPKMYLITALRRKLIQHVKRNEIHQRVEESAFMDLEPPHEQGS
ncbi:MAG: hypothetical protein HC842_08145 [Cytophagales bacterium]|nr:hypothetical protein [Cytophagales bacterium]